MTNNSNRADNNGVDGLDELEMFQLDDQDEALIQIEEGLQEASEALEDPYQGQGLPPARRIETQPVERRRSRTSRKASNGSGLSATGYVLLVLGITLAGLSVADIAAMRPTFVILTKTGITPALLLLAGVVLLSVSALRQRQARIQDSVEDVTSNLGDSGSDVMANLEYLVSAQEQHLERRPASGEELEQVLMLLQRQDDKVNNLTKALKMYGKPLIEITKMLSDGSTRQEAIAASITANREQISDMQEAMLLTGEAVQKLPAQIHEIQAGMAQSGADEDLYNILKQVQREVGGLATSVSQIRSGGGVVSGGSAPLAPSAPTASAADASTPPAGGSDSLAQSISGTKSSSGKGVLGSIQKLRKMRK